MDNLSQLIQRESHALMPFYAEVEYIPNVMGDGLLIKDRADQGNLEGVEKLVENSGLPSSHINHIKQLNKSIDQFIGMLRDYESSGKYEAFASWCRVNGYGNPPKPNKVAASEQPEEAVAWTPGNRDYPLIGANKYLEDRISKIASNYNLSRDEAIEMVITHELFHNVQNSTVKSKGNAYTEQDCEEKMYQFFTEKSQSTKNPQERQKYLKIAKAAGQRATAWQKARGKRSDYSSKMKGDYTKNTNYADSTSEKRTSKSGYKLQSKTEYSKRDTISKTKYNNNYITNSNQRTYH